MLDTEDVGKDAQEVFFEKLRTFVVGHETALHKMQQTLRDDWDHTTWDAFTDSVQLQLGERNCRTAVADTLGPNKLHNQLFYRITLVLSTITLEMKSLRDELYDVLLPPLAMYGDPAVGQEGVPDEEAQQGLGRLIPHLMDIWHWVHRCETVVVSALRNLASLYAPHHGKDKLAPYQTVHFPLVWHALSDLLGAVVSLEEAIVSHDVLRQGVTVFRRMLANMAKDPEKFGTGEFEVEQFGKLLTKIENDLLSDAILLSICTAQFDTTDVPVMKNGGLFTEFSARIQELTSHVGTYLGTPREGEARVKYVGLCGLFVLYFCLFKSKLQADPSLHKTVCKSIFDLHRAVPVIHINAVNIFTPAQWLFRRVPGALSPVVRDPVNEGMSAIKEACLRSSNVISGRVNLLLTMTSVWCAEMQSSFSCDRTHAKRYMQQLVTLIERGILFAQEIQRVCKDLIFLHQSADLRLSLAMVDAIHMCIVLLVMIRSAFHAKTSMLSALFNLLIKSPCYAMRKQLYGLHMKINENMLTSSEAITDQHTAIGQALALLEGPMTPQAIACLDIVLSIAFNRSDCCFDSKEFSGIMHSFTNVAKLTRFQVSVAHATDCEFLYWQREGFIPLFFERLFNRPSNSQYLLDTLIALQDCGATIASSRHVEDPRLILEQYKKFVLESLEDKLVVPLVRGIETDLRLNTHAEVLGQPYSKADKNRKDLARFIQLPPFHLFNSRLCVKSMVEDHLDQEFYNLNALNTNDWKTYEEMRTLALERFGLSLVEGHLPGGIVDQGLDVLVITKNIQVFVANYTYNLNEQLFVQRPSATESKHLHTLAVRHISNSIRTHGTGIMNTTVNYVYKCLLKKLSILSQFLYDEHVKGRLLKDIKYFAANKDQLAGYFPVARAEKFCYEMRKLGVLEDGRTYLDQFRQLVSEIGNALAYMRMVRSGGLRSMADAAVFLPELDSLPQLERCVNPDMEEDEEDGDGMLEDIVTGAATQRKVDEVAETTVDAVRVVDAVAKNMSKRLAQGSDYFKMLEEAIAKKLSDESKYSHLKNFHMIIPPMCISFVDHMVHQREQLMKKNKEGLFTDDGFALGCVFLLSLFHVHEPFDSLHWFHSVGKFYEEKKRKMDESIMQRKAKTTSTKAPSSAEYSMDGELNSMQLTLTMVESHLREYTELTFAFDSCRVFFKYKPAGEDKEEEEEDEDEADDFD